MQQTKNYQKLQAEMSILAFLLYTFKSVVCTVTYDTGKLNLNQNNLYSLNSKCTNEQLLLSPEEEIRK